jgi:cation transport ATPase
MAASLEYLSDHPMSGAILEKAQSEGIEPADVSSFESVSGRGLKGIILGGLVRVGSRTFMTSEGVLLKPDEEDRIVRREREESQSSSSHVMILFWVLLHLQMR